MSITARRRSAAPACGANLVAMAPTPLRPPAISDTGDGGPSSAEGRAWPGTFDAPETVERVWTDFVAALPDPGHRTALRQALAFARARHGTQFRRGSETPYWVHLVRVAMELARWGEGSPVLLQAALLHDTVEDTRTTDRRGPRRLRARGGRPRQLADRPGRPGSAARLLRAPARQRALRRPGAEARRPRGQPAQHPGARDAHRPALPPLGRHLPAPHHLAGAAARRRRPRRWRVSPS